MKLELQWNISLDLKANFETYWSIDDPNVQTNIASTYTILRGA